MPSTFSDLYPQLFQTLIKHGQTHVLSYWNELSEIEQTALLKQLNNIDFELLGSLYAQYQNKPATSPQDFSPANTVSEQTLTKLEVTMAKNAGIELLKSNKVALLVVAGGQGTRLGFAGPKGCYQIQPNKTIFEIFASNIKDLNKAYGLRLDWYIMTSQATDLDTKNYFQQNNFLGLPPNSVHFFQQAMLPSLDLEGKLVLDTKNHIAENPNGHGGTLVALKEDKIFDELSHKGIEELFYFQVDNPLAKIADPLFIGLHKLTNAEMSTKVVRKELPEEKVGIVGYINNKLGVIEYSELSPKQAQKRNSYGNLVFSAANTAIHMINIDFAIAETSQGFKLPYHIALKKIPCLPITARNNATLAPITPQNCLSTEPGIKFETFIFDALADTTNSVVLEVDRATEFAPLKNAEGADSPETVRRALGF